MSDDSDLEDVLGTQVPAAGSRSPAGKSKGATSDKAKTPKLDKELSTVSEPTTPATPSLPPGQIPVDMSCKNTRTTFMVQVSSKIDVAGDVGTVGRFTQDANQDRATLHLQGYALEGTLARCNTMLVLEVGKQKEGARGKVTNVIDHYFHVASESIVKGETVLEGIGLTDEDVRDLQTSAEVMQNFRSTKASSKPGARLKSAPMKKKPKLSRSSSKSGKKAA